MTDKKIENKDKKEIATESGCDKPDNSYRKKVKDIAKHPNIKKIKSEKKLIISYSPVEEEKAQLIDFINKHNYEIKNWKDLVKKVQRLDDISTVRDYWDAIKRNTQHLTGYKRVSAKINNHDVNLIIAATTEQKKIGLQIFANELNEDCGMLFDFDALKHVAFHMGEVKFPIDIVFLMQKVDGPTVVEDTVENVQPGDKNVFSANARYVLELKAGSCKKYNIVKNKVLNFHLGDCYALDK